MHKNSKFEASLSYIARPCLKKESSWLEVWLSGRVLASHMQSPRFGPQHRGGGSRRDSLQEKISKIVQSSHVFFT
jgi:hypothetical protein